MATATLTSAAGVPPAEDAIPIRRIFAFIAMVFGMFMAILDIQIVSASLAEIQAGLSASQRRDRLGPDRLSDRRSDHDPAVGLSEPGALDARLLLDRGRRLHHRQRALRDVVLDQRDDPVARGAGLHRRRHDPRRLRRRLHASSRPRSGRSSRRSSGSSRRWRRRSARPSAAISAMPSPGTGSSSSMSCPASASPSRPGR